MGHHGNVHLMKSHLAVVGRGAAGRAVATKPGTVFREVWLQLLTLLFCAKSSIFTMPVLFVRRLHPQCFFLFGYPLTFSQAKRVSLTLVNITETNHSCGLTLKVTQPGVPVMAQQKQIQRVSMRIWVRSLASLGGSGIPHCRELWCRSRTWLRFQVDVALV